jgi:D-aspartate ligase
MSRDRTYQGRATPDASVPVVFFQVGNYPFQHGSLGAIRSLGRLGVECYLVLKNRIAPHGLSRYIERRFRFENFTDVSDSEFLGRLALIHAQVGRPAVLVPTDDEAAILVARLAPQLRTAYILPDVAPDLPAILASKHRLHLLCREHGVPTPETTYVETAQEAVDVARRADYPLVIKNSEPWSRLKSPAVRSTTIVRSVEDFMHLASAWQSDPHVVIQRYLPQEHAEDWIVHVYCDRSADAILAFTGRKYRSWPATAGVTTMAEAQPNSELHDLAIGFCKAIGYRGIADMDWRFDTRDRRYRLVDFNPRLGANFRLFTTGGGIDVVRGAYLDLTGQEIADRTQDFDRRFCVENLDLLSRFASRKTPHAAPARRVTTTELAWFAWDDPAPFLAMGLRFGGQSAKRLAAMARSRIAGAARKPVTADARSGKSRHDG